MNKKRNFNNPSIVLKVTAILYNKSKRQILAEFFSSIIGINNSYIIGIATRSPLRRVAYEVSNPS